MSYPAPTEHGPVEPIDDDLFMVRGSIRMNALMRITRNMAVLRHDGELTLVNPIRLNDAGERELTALGPIKRILRLGAFHGLDDPYYAERHGAELWATGPSEAYAEPPIARLLAEEDEPPFPDVALFVFSGSKQPEAALLVKRQRPVLLTCDAIQHYGDYRYNTLLARLLMPWIGFPRTTLVGPIWLKHMTPDGGSLESEFRRLLTLDFERLLAAHGSFKSDNAKAAVTVAVQRAFPGRAA